MREQVLALVQKYLPGVAIRPSGGDNVLLRCPFHKSGREQHPSFSVSLSKGLYNCFTCKTSGSLKRLLHELGVSRDRIDIELEGIEPFLERQRRQFQFERANTFAYQDPFEAEPKLPEALLGIYDWMPLTLVEKGFSPEILRSFEVGFDRLQNRVTYPIRDLYGNLAGISGGSIIPGTSPRYKVYQGGHQANDGSWKAGDLGLWFDEEFPGYRFENHDFLWNFDRLYPRLVEMSGGPATVYLVEGFKACLWMVQAGLHNTIALMGSSISDRQQLMLHRLGVRLVLCLDNDDAGRKGNLSAGTLLYTPMHGNIFVMEYPGIDDDSQPDDYPLDILPEMVDAAKPFKQYQAEVLADYPSLRQWYEAKFRKQRRSRP